jgi:hypothetical protein
MPMFPFRTDNIHVPSQSYAERSLEKDFAWAKTVIRKPDVNDASSQPRFIRRPRLDYLPILESVFSS